MLPDSLRTIGSYAFRNNKLKGVVIPASVTSIGSSAFSGCSALTSITIPEAVTSIGSSAFYGCSSLYKSAYPSGLSNPFFYGVSIAYSKECSIDENNVIYDAEKTKLFYAPVTLEGAYIIPNSVTSIESNAFYGCSALTAITIPEAVTSIGSSAFSGCTSLDTLTFNAISCSDFYSSDNVFPSSISSLTFGDKVTSIPAYFLYNGSKIENLTIPNAVISIGSDAFRHSSSLKSVTFGSGLITIGGSSSSYNAFSGTSIAKAFWLGNTPPSGCNYVNAKVNYVANDQYSLSNQMKYQFLSSRFTVDGVVYIPVSPAERTCDIVDCIYDEAFSSFDISDKVTNMGIEMNVVNVNQYAFYDNKYIQDLTISNNGAIGDYAFYGCSYLATSAISNSSSIGQSAFQGCDSLLVMDIPNSVTSLGASAFQNCSALESVKIGTGIPSLQALVFSGCSSLSSISIPGNISAIRDYAFQGCSSLAQVTLEDAEVQTDNSIHFPDWTSSGQSYSYKQYTLSVVPGSVLSFDYTIDNGSLYISLYGANVSHYQNYYGSGEFRYEFQQEGNVTLELSYSNYSGKSQASVTGITVVSPNALISIGSNGSNPLFADCPLDSVYIGRNIWYNTSSSYGYSPFYRNASLRTVTITDEETEIGDNEFYGCTNLKNVTIGNGVTTIGDWAFSGCSSLDYFAFGSAVETIGKEAFSDCTAMTRIISHAVTPPVCGSQALDDINKWTCVLSVPEGNTAAYQQADQWKEFFFINDDVSGVDVPSTKDQPRVKDCYDLNGKQISQPQRGLNIIRMSDGTTKKVVVR